MQLSLENDVSARMAELVDILNEASKAYYQEARELMSDHDYDRLYDELLQLERESGVVLANSPTKHVGFQVLSQLEKVKHDQPMLSLDKTKDREHLRQWLGDQQGDLSWKLDGLTVVLTYENGRLSRAVTRGNGDVGEDVTKNAAYFINLPKTISYQGRVVIRGEAVIAYRDFEEINGRLEPEKQFKNPRNLCSGSVRALDPAVTAERRVHVVVYTLVDADNIGTFTAKHDELRWLSELGFETVESVSVDASNLLEAIAVFSNKIQQNAYPSDGLVLTYDDMAYSQSLGRTSKFPRDSMAFKWQDEQAATVLRMVEWQTSRTGLINPVAVFDPVELEGTTVQRASVHNLSIIDELQLGIGDEITVYKANMIIPQIAENRTRSHNLSIPKVCPRCMAPTKEVCTNDARVLVCTNDDCPAKLHRAFVHFCSRSCLNIEGLSEMYLDQFIEAGLLNEYPDVFHLKDHRETILQMDGFKDKKTDNILAGVENARHTQTYRLIAALGIPDIGPASAKTLCKAFHGDVHGIMSAKAEDIANIDGFAMLTAEKVVGFFQNEQNRQTTEALLAELDLYEEESVVNEAVAGKTFVITGSLHHFERREDLAHLIETQGGHVGSSVSNKTAYLINNDLDSTSGKNRKAHELGIPIISEDEALVLLNDSMKEELS